MPTLDWLNREEAFRIAQRVPTRVLRPHTAALAPVGDATAAQGNLLVQGDNLEALAALLPFYRGRVKCIFIDPPYNTKNAFEHYDDNLEHCQWLTMMLPRLQLLREFLREDGSIWVTIDNHLQVVRWVRNLDSDPVCGFWLPTSAGRFYPDFVAELKDGRLLVVEYKGEHLRNVPKEIEKAEAGCLWAARSDGRCVFVMPFKELNGSSAAQQIDAAISSRT